MECQRERQWNVDRMTMGDILRGEGKGDLEVC